MGNTVLGPANTAKYICIWPPAKYTSNTFEAYNPGHASNTAKYICIWPLAKYATTVNTYFPSRPHTDIAQHRRRCGGGTLREIA
eukprot:scaffold70891_cov31-Tisochrysis_lutea.AAC.2